MLIGLFALAIVVMKLFPETALGEALHRFLVEIPLSIAERLERKHIILVVILVCSFQTLALVPTTELAMAVAADMALYADAVLATSIAAFASRIKGAWTAFKNLVSRCFPKGLRMSGRARRSRPSRDTAKKPSNDDEPAWQLIAQAA